MKRHITRQGLFPLLLPFLLLTGCSDGEAPPPEEPRTGRLVIIGGALQAENEAVYQAILEGREGDGQVCVLPTASGAPEESMASAVTALDRWGGEGTALGVLVTVEAPEEADTEALASTLMECSGFYFTGGSQSRIIDVFRPAGRATLGYQALMERWQAGAVVSGTSAGAAMMSTRSIAGGGSLEALETGLAATDGDDGVWVREGMGFVPWAIVDQHFLARGRWGRLLVALTLDPEVDLGVGIDENTALVVDGDQATVVGASGVIWMDGRGATLDPVEGNARGVTLHLLGRGDGVDVRTGEVTVAAGKRPRAGGDDAVGTEGPEERQGSEEAVAPEAVFERWALLHLLAGWPLEGGEPVAVGPEGVITLAPSPGFRSLRLPGEGVEGTPDGLSVGPLTVTLER